jgi:hypothetical protein
MIIVVFISLGIFLASLVLDLVKDQLVEPIKQWLNKKGISLRFVWILFLSLALLIIGLEVLQEVLKNKPTNSLLTSPTVSTITQTFTLTSAPSLTPTPTSTFTDTPTATFTTTPDVPTQVVGKIASYYDCINTYSGKDLERCWNLLSDRSGEVQQFLITYADGLEGFIIKWNQYKVSYNLYYCYDKTVLAEEILYNRNNLNEKINFGNPYYLRYLLALDTNGWRIAHYYYDSDLSIYNVWRVQSGFESVPDINSGCDTNQPMIQKTPAQ